MIECIRVGKRYAPGTTITSRDDVTLWAQWTRAEDSWYVVYNANGGTKAPKTQIVRQGEDAVLSEELPEAGRMIFKGWTTNPKAPKVEYKPGDVLPYDSGKNVVVLYAVWNLSPVPKPIHIAFDANGLDRRRCYKACVKAWKKVEGKKVYIGDASPEVHAITGGYNGKYYNARSVKLDKRSLTMKAGDSRTLKATVEKVKSNRELLNHTAKVRYYSSNASLAAVDENGRVTAVAKGACRIWAIAPNGVRASARVTVK